jgi:hypothetical protein
MLPPDARFMSINLWMASDLLRSRVALEAEILVLRQQINVPRPLIQRGFDLFRLTG